MIGQKLDQNILPNFIIIGAAKAGTTTLFDVIGQNPGVLSSTVKEVKFFSRDERYAKGVEWYQDKYFPNANRYQVRMEASPAYLTWSDKVAPRIKEVYRDQPLKFAAIFRDPVKRAYSHYWHRVRLGTETASTFEEAIYTEEERLKKNWDWLSTKGDGLYGYYRAGCYATRLKPFLELFPRESFFFLLQDDLQTDFEGSIISLLNFLNLTPHNFQPIKRNEAVLPKNRQLGVLYSKLKKSRIGSLLKRFTSKSNRKGFEDSFLYKPAQYPPMNVEVKKYLYARYLVEIKQLELILERDLSHWKSD